MKENKDKEPYFANCSYRLGNIKMVKGDYFDNTYCENLGRLMRCSDCGFGQRLQSPG